MTRAALCGVFAASITPLKSDLTPDIEAVAPYLGFLAARGCHGALLSGTTGEGPSFSAAERASVWRAALRVREEFPDFWLLAGTGTPSLTETIDLTKMAFDMGYDAVFTLPPYYFRAATEDGLFDWFGRVMAKAVPKDGLLFGYHFPGVAGIGFSLGLLARLKDSFPRQFAGLKDSSHDAGFARALGSRFGTDLAVFSGTDSDFSLALENHAAGCITAAANLLSPELRQVYDAFVNHTDGSALQLKITAQRHILEKYLPFPPTLKALLARLHQQPRWPVRPPLVEISHEVEEQLVCALSGAGA
jgi:4-hydroxy-tetrahydrodipicolinate synthase